MLIQVGLAHHKKFWTRPTYLWTKTFYEPKPKTQINLDPKECPTNPSSNMVVFFYSSRAVPTADGGQRLEGNKAATARSIGLAMSSSNNLQLPITVYPKNSGFCPVQTRVQWLRVAASVDCAVSSLWLPVFTTRMAKALSVICLVEDDSCKSSRAASTVGWGRRQQTVAVL